MGKTDKTLLRLSGLAKRFGGFQAVNNVSFDLPAGAIGGLIGPNGAGKTTLFNILAGMLVADAGTVLLDNQPITGLPPHKVFAKGLARSFQIPRPFAEMTVLENVMMVPMGQSGELFWQNWLAPSRVAAEERVLREKALETIEFCGLTPVKGNLANALSGGQMKLLELARVLMSDPRLILLDEPAAGVNPALMATIIDKIQQLNARGYSFLIIEHNMDMVMSVCDPVFVMSQGELIYQGPPEGAQKNQMVLDAYLGGAA